jgi:hypothetical protein
MEERVFFDDGDVRVTNARFIVNGQTYAMNGVTSVKQAVQHPSRVWPVLFGLVGLMLLIAGGSMGWGIIFLVVALLWWLGQKAVWIVVLHSASGEVRALTSHNRDYIHSVITALNDSIVHRG